MPGLSYLAQSGPPVPTSWIYTLPPVTYVPHCGLISLNSTPISRKYIAKIKIVLRSFRDSPHQACITFVHMLAKMAKSGPNFIWLFCMLTTLLVHPSSCDRCLIQNMYKWVKMSSVKCIFISKFATSYRSDCRTRLQI